MSYQMNIWHSKRFINFCQDIISSDYLTIAYKYIFRAGWVSTCIKNSSDRIKFTCFPWICMVIKMIFLYFHLPFINKSRNATANTQALIFLFLESCFAGSYYQPLYFSAVTVPKAYNLADSTFRTAFNFLLSLFKLPCF